jgi:RNA polymerase sigma-70 factor (ECF subfamily)
MREAASSGRAVNATPQGAYEPGSMGAETSLLMAAAKHGDREAFDRLVEGLRSQAFHVARGLVGSREDALDVAQEAFLKVYRARESYREGEPFLPWFHQILRNTCYSFLRREGRIAKRSLSAPRGPEADDEGDWEIADEREEPDPLEADERARIFWQAFRRLSARDREVLSLRHFRELSYQEIADVLAIPIGTVMSRLFHARRRLREGLGGLLDDDEGLPAAAGARARTERTGEAR